MVEYHVHIGKDYKALLFWIRGLTDMLNISV
jgi:hypothetical protein